MDKKRGLLEKLVVAAGGMCLLMIMVLFCFTEIRIPDAGYAAAWLCCLYVMLKGACGIRPGVKGRSCRSLGGSSRIEKCVS